MQLDVLHDLLRADADRAAELLLEARACAEHAIDHLRSAVTDLTPEVPADQTLIDDLADLVHELGRRWDLDLSLVFAGPCHAVEKDGVGLVHAFIQEALTNLHKHSTGRRASVLVDFEDETVRVTVRSGGSARNSSGRGRYSSGSGLKLMRGRARLLGGDVQFDSRRNGDTRVKLVLPLVAAS